MPRARECAERVWEGQSEEATTEARAGWEDEEHPEDVEEKRVEPGKCGVAGDGGWKSYKEKVARLAERATELQRPIRILNALKWDAKVREEFRRGQHRELPKVEYDRGSIGFDAEARAREFQELADEVSRALGGDDAIAKILRATCLEYRDVCRMLLCRGTPEFYAYSRRLYGSPKEVFPDGKTTVRDVAHGLYGLLTGLDGSVMGPRAVRDLDSAAVVELLRGRFDKYFGHGVVQVSADGGILADAAAGSGYVKIREGARFSEIDVDVLEVHEGWVHVATSLNGGLQRVARWLSKGPPRTAAAQEGLATLMEMLTFRSHPRRARRLNERVMAIDKAEDGADFLEVFEWHRTEGYEEEECFNAARRVFRGGVMTGGAPFTKDLVYTKGLVTNYHFIRAAIRACRPELVRFLFVGKIAHEDVPVLWSRVADGVIDPPVYLPEVIADLNGLAMWMAYLTFFSQMGLKKLDDYYVEMFERI